ncbi:MAG: SIR2 family NAD-dependent protein deacylase [Acidimicrobiales bacterium]
MARDGVAGEASGEAWDRPDPEALAEAADVVAAARSVVVLTGAGISTAAGIPDFRGPQGLWTRNPEAERLSSLDHYLADPEVRRRSWQARLTSPVWEARPTAGHVVLVDLEHAGKLHTIVTQNTDGLHQAAGTSPDRVVEVHGTTHWVACWSCGDRTPTLTVLARVRLGEEDPHCLRPGCGGILKSATVSFGQSLDPADLDRAFLAAAEAEVLVAVGTTLEVQPVAGMVPIAVRSGRPVVIVNGSPTALDSLADVVVRGAIDEVLPVIAGVAG